MTKDQHLPESAPVRRSERFDIGTAGGEPGDRWVTGDRLDRPSRGCGDGHSMVGAVKNQDLSPGLHGTAIYANQLGWFMAYMECLGHGFHVQFYTVDWWPGMARLLFSAGPSPLVLSECPSHSAFLGLQQPPPGFRQPTLGLKAAHTRAAKKRLWSPPRQPFPE